MGGTPVALKKLNEIGSSKELMQESELLASLNHPNIGSMESIIYSEIF